MISDEQAEQFVKALHEKTQRDQEPKTIIVARNARGFEVGEFHDLNGRLCYIQKSSLATDNAIWLGVEGDTMQINRQMVAALLPHLTKFAETGEL